MFAAKHGPWALVAGAPNMVAYGASKAFDMVFAEALANLGNGPTVLVGDVMKTAGPMLGSMSRKQAVELLTAAGAATMG